MLRMLAEVLAGLIHGPEVYGAVAVAEEIDTAVPAHGILAGSVEIARDWHGFLAVRILPEILCGAALVALGVAALKIHTSKEQRAALAEGALRGLTQRHDLNAIVGVDGGELSVGQRGVAPRRVEDFCVGSPAYNRRVALERSADRQAAGGRYRVDLGWAFIIRRVGDGLAVRRERRVSLFAGMRGEAACDSALQANGPQIAFRRENDGVVMDGGEAIIAAVGLGEDEWGECSESEGETGWEHTLQDIVEAECGGRNAECGMRNAGDEGGDGRRGRRRRRTWRR